MSMWWLLAGPAALVLMEFGRYCGAVNERHWWVSMVHRARRADGIANGPDKPAKGLDYVSEHTCERAELTWRWMPLWARRLLFGDECRPIR